MKLLLHSDGMVRSIGRDKPLGSGTIPYIHFPSTRYIRTYGPIEDVTTVFVKDQVRSITRP